MKTENRKPKTENDVNYQSFKGISFPPITKERAKFMKRNRKVTSLLTALICMLVLANTGCGSNSTTGQGTEIGGLGNAPDDSGDDSYEEDSYDDGDEAGSYDDGYNDDSDADSDEDSDEDSDTDDSGYGDSISSGSGNEDQSDEDTDNPTGSGRAASKSNGSDSDKNAKSVSGLALGSYDGDFFSLTIPKGWSLQTFGEYVDFGFCMTNPDNSAMKIFRYGRLAPFLKSTESKKMWQSLYGTGLLPDAPVMTDRSAKGLLGLWSDCISYQQKYGSTTFPELGSINVVSSQNYSGPFSAYGGTESTAVASARSGNGQTCQCVLSTAVMDPGSNYNNGIDTSYLILYETVGIIAPQNTSAEDIQSMMSCATSVEFTEDYINKSNASSDSALSSVSQQLDENRALMNAMQKNFLEYIQN